MDESTAARMIGVFLDAGYNHIDTALNYTEGRSEEMLGRIITPEMRPSIYLATKVGSYETEGLKPETVFRQVETSLRRLKTDYVDLLYLHKPDLETPVEKTLEAFQKLREQGKFRKLGLSNYAAWQAVDIWHSCRENGWPAPTVYQGMYNALTRAVEPELLPALVRCGYRFFAYNPLAGGLLSGKYRQLESIPNEGRFAALPFYQARYWKEAYFQAVEEAGLACREEKIPLAEAALRWITHHSDLDLERGDGLVLGMSNLKHLEDNLKSMEAGPLPENIARTFDRAWEISRPLVPKYFRP